MTEKTREKKLREAARLKGYLATKGHNEYGETGWMLMDRSTNVAIHGYLPVAYSLSLEEAEEIVSEEAE